MKIHGSRKIKINKINITSITKQPYEMQRKYSNLNQQLYILLTVYISTTVVY